MTVKDDVDIGRIWRFLATNRWLIGLIGFFGLSIGALIAFLSTPVYRAEVLMAYIESEATGTDGIGALASQFGGLASLAGVNLPQEGGKEEALAILGSRQFSQRFIEDEKLLPELFRDEWDAETSRWATDDPEEIPTLNKAVARFDRDIRTVSEDKDSGLVTLSIIWRDREEAARWANELAGRLNATMRQDAIEAAERNIGFLNDQLSKTSIVDIRQAIYGLVEAEIKKIMLANTREEYVFRVLDPAGVPDPDEVVWPIKSLVIIVGLFAGLFFGTFIAMILTAVRTPVRENGDAVD